MNPCPCGYLGDASGRCRCTAEQVQRYRARISGPLLDRIDMHIEVPPVPQEMLRGEHPAAPHGASRQLRERVAEARQTQLQRCGKLNRGLSTGEVERFCTLDPAGIKLMGQALERLGLSARAYHRVLKVARTIADLARSDMIEAAHLGEALTYRRL